MTRQVRWSEWTGPEPDAPLVRMLHSRVVPRRTGKRVAHGVILVGVSTITTMQTFTKGCRFARRNRSTGFIGMTTMLVSVLVAPIELQAAKRAASPSASKDQADYKSVVIAKVEIKQSSGKVLRGKPRQLEWEAQSSVQLEADGHVHDVQLQVEKKDDQGRKLGVTLAYDVDGEAVIAPFEYDTTAKKREILRVDGGIALAVTLTPKKIEIEAPEPDDDIEVPDGQNPLDGLK